MKKIILLTCMFITCIAFENINNVELISVYDGDTFKVNIKNFPAIVGEKISIRVNGIDTPEIRGKCIKEKELAYMAKDTVITFLQSGTIVLKNPKRGKYFRIVADVEVNQKSLADELLRKGLAVPYDGGTKIKDWCK